MKKSELKIFADGLEKIQKNHAVAKKVTLKITSMIDASEKIIYSQEIKADELQVGNFNAFRKEVNILTTYHNGLNIAETDCKLEIGGKIFKFKGGKFASKLNLLVNQAVTRSSTVRGANFYPWGNWGIAKLVKARDFDSRIRWFESSYPSHFVIEPSL